MITKFDEKKPLYNSFKVTEWLYAGEYPGDKVMDIAKEKIEQCLKFGITHFIDLTEDGELVPYKSLVEGKAHYLRFPIVDESIPEDIVSVRKLLEEIIGIYRQDTSSRFYVHCWGGVGRTGVIVGCFLGFLYGMNYEDAIKKLRLLFMDCPKSGWRVIPETDEQLDYIRRFIESEFCK